MAPKTPRTPQTPSKTLNKVEWKQCSLCKATFVLRDSLRHEAICSVIAANDFAIVDANHGFVSNKVFYALWDENGCKECFQVAVKFQRCHFVLVSPSAMQLTGIQIGSFVAVQTNDRKFSTFMAWPCSHIPASSIYIDPEVLKSLQITQGKSFQLTAINTSIKIASHLKIKILDNHSQVEKFEQMFVKQFEGHVVCKGAFLVYKQTGKKWPVSIEYVTCKEDLNSISDLSKEISSLTIDSTSPSDYFLILKNTRISFITETEPSFHQDMVALEDFGGSEDVVREIKKLCTNIFLRATPSKNRCPRGVLLYGPSGTGKSLLVRVVASHFQVALVTIQGPELFSKYYGETETRLRDKFDEAIKNDCCIIFIDEIDALCPKRESSSSSHSDQERRVVATLLSMLDSIPSSSRVIVIGVTNRPDALDPAIRRPGRLDREMEIRAPTVVERKQILSALLRKIPNQLQPNDVDRIASVTHGFVGADLSLLCAEASLAAAKRVISHTHSGDNLQEQAILPEDAEYAIHLVKPSAMREVLVEVPDVRWTDIGGQEELKLKLKQAVEWPLRYPEAFKRLGVEPPRGLLMFGPPGCSKTMIAKALATESGLNFIAVKGPELFSKWVGESERAVREVFRRARQVAPSIIFLDELDALGSARGSGSSSTNVGDRVLAQLLTEMDGIEALKDVTVVAATNRPDMIDKALLRPGRLDRIVYVSLPDDNTRREILQLKFKKMPVDSDVSLDWLVECTQGYSGAEVSAVCNEAALRALEENIQILQVSRRHYEFALCLVKPRITSETIAFYENYVKESGMHSI